MARASRRARPRREASSTLTAARPLSRPFRRLFDAPPGAATGHHALLAGKRLPLILDLDETLLQAVTLRSFDERVESTARRAAAAAQEAAAGGEAAAAKLALLTSDLGRLLADRALLHEYAATDGVTLATGRLAAQPEASAEDAAAPPRPVLRLPGGGGVVLTRIDPARRDTSMFVRVRPGWDELRAFLTGGDRRSRREAAGGADGEAAASASPPAPRFDVFVCTLSEKGYAREMWRLLDPDGALIAPAARNARLVATPPDRLKTLRGALGGSPCAPLALVVDDRPSIWEASAQGNVLPLAPFLPYATADGSGEGATGSWPLAAVRSALEATRGAFFHALHERHAPRLAAATHCDDPASLPPPPDAVGALRPHLKSALARPADAPPDAPPPPAGDALRGADLQALLAAAATPSPLQQLLAASSSGSAQPQAAPPAVGAARAGSMTAMLAEAMSAGDGQASYGGAGLGLSASVPTTALRPGVAAVGGALDGPFQMLRQEADRRGAIIDWECRYDGYGDAKVWTAVPHLGGQELARAQGPNKRAAQDKAAAIALGRLRAESAAGGGVSAGMGMGMTLSAGAASAASPQQPLPPGAAARMANLPGAPGSDKPLTAALAVPTLSVFWERLEAELGAPAAEGHALEYRVVAGVDAGHAAVVVELWAGRPPRAVSKGAGPGRKEATQRAALAALRQEGFAVAAELPGGSAAAAVLATVASGGAHAATEAAAVAAAKRKADDDLHAEAAKRAGLMGEHL